MTEKETTRISKFLSMVLRHEPQRIGITLNENGWTPVKVLLERLNNHGLAVDMSELQHVVKTNAKQRFAFSEDERLIRANQGHSIKVDLGFVPQPPPGILYHGTAEKNLASILVSGLHKRQRHHVHLSLDKETAMAVGRRYGKPVVLEIRAGAMHEEGYVFHLSQNTVWLTDEVPPRYIKV
jgi:putative RNA 2'-phosphotransferase